MGKLYHQISVGHVPKVDATVRHLTVSSLGADFFPALYIKFSTLSPILAHLPL
jgi:hypothetical protein